MPPISTNELLVKALFLSWPQLLDPEKPIQSREMRLKQFLGDPLPEDVKALLNDYNKPHVVVFKLRRGLYDKGDGSFSRDLEIKSILDAPEAAMSKKAVLSLIAYPVEMEIPPTRAGHIPSHFFTPTMGTVLSRFRKPGEVAIAQLNGLGFPENVVRPAQRMVAEFTDKNAILSMMIEVEKVRASRWHLLVGKRGYSDYDERWRSGFLATISGQAYAQHVLSLARPTHGETARLTAALAGVEYLSTESVPRRSPGYQDPPHEDPWFIGRPAGYGQSAWARRQSQAAFCREAVEANDLTQVMKIMQRHAANGLQSLVDDSFWTGGYDDQESRSREFYAVRALLGENIPPPSRDGGPDSRPRASVTRPVHVISPREQSPVSLIKSFTYPVAVGF
jgi:hypothetical protein